MSVKTYQIPCFAGLDQSGDENRLNPVFSPDAVNMDTAGGRLSVAAGYAKLSSAQLPGSGRIDHLCCLRTAGNDVPVAITSGKVYALIEDEWVLEYTYDNPASFNYDSAMVRIDSTDYLVIADGLHQMIKFDGESVSLFGSSEGCSDVPCAYLTLYRGRLFAAGDRANPDRIYYSCLPGSGRTVEDWGFVQASPSVEGGHAEVGAVGGDPIVAIRALSNQLLIFKKNSLYRLIGDRPGNFTIEHIDADVPTTRHTAVTAFGDVMYFVTKYGLYCYNGVTARPCPDMQRIKRFMETANVARCRAVTVRDKIYFSVRQGLDDEVMVYDLTGRIYMRRAGFAVHDMTAMNGRLLLMNGRRYPYVFGVGATYDGEPVKAYWTTPLTDLEDKAAIKSPKMLFIRGEGGPVKIETELDGKRRAYRAFPGSDRSTVYELPLFGGGRTMRLIISNENGGGFTLEGGLETELSIRRRTE